MRKLCLVACLIALICAFGCSSEQAASPAHDTSEAVSRTGARVLKLGNSGAKEERAAKACQIFCELVNERLAGEIVFEFYPAGQLGDETIMLKNVQSDSQQGVMTAIDTLANYAPDLNIISMAFAFDSHEHVMRYLESDLARPAFEKLESQGIHVLSFNFKKNPRVIFGKKPLITPDDLEGLRFRVPDIPIFKRNIEQLGAEPVVVSWGEYPLALLQGIVDAGECTKEALYACAFYESCKYVSEVDYSYPVEALSISQKTWDSLTENQQQTLEECARLASERFNDEVQLSWEDDRRKLIELGVQFVDFDSAAFHSKIEPLAKKLEEQNFWDTPGLYEKVRALSDG